MCLYDEFSVFNPGIFFSGLGIKLKLVVAPSVSTYIITPLAGVGETLFVEFIAPYQFP
jgi:hypothetical protein